MQEPTRKVSIERSAKRKINGFEVEAQNCWTYLREYSALPYAAYDQAVAVPAGREQEVIELLQWVKEERARWAALALNDRAEV